MPSTKDCTATERCNNCASQGRQPQWYRDIPVCHGCAAADQDSLVICADAGAVQPPAAHHAALRQQSFQPPARLEPHHDMLEASPKMHSVRCTSIRSPTTRSMRPPAVSAACRNRSTVLCSVSLPVAHCLLVQPVACTLGVALIKWLAPPCALCL